MRKIKVGLIEDDLNLVGAWSKIFEGFGHTIEFYLVIIPRSADADRVDQYLKGETNYALNIFEKRIYLVDDESPESAIPKIVKYIICHSLDWILSDRLIDLWAQKDIKNRHDIVYNGFDVVESLLQSCPKQKIKLLTKKQLEQVGEDHRRYPFMTGNYLVYEAESVKKFLENLLREQALLTQILAEYFWPAEYHPQGADFGFYRITHDVKDVVANKHRKSTSEINDSDIVQYLIKENVVRKAMGAVEQLEAVIILKESLRLTINIDEVNKERRPTLDRINKYIESFSDELTKNQNPYISCTYQEFKREFRVGCDSTTTLYADIINQAISIAQNDQEVKNKGNTYQVTTQICPTLVCHVPQISKGLTHILKSLGKHLISSAIDVVLNYGPSKKCIIFEFRAPQTQTFGCNSSGSVGGNKLNIARHCLFGYCDLDLTATFQDGRFEVDMFGRREPIQLNDGENEIIYRLTMYEPLTMSQKVNK